MYDPRLNDRQSPFDWTLIFAITGLMILGLAFIYSASQGHDNLAHLRWHQLRHIRQLAFYLLGIGIAGALCLTDYHQIARWSLVIYWGTILLLLAVLIPGIGASRFGARRWIDLGVFQLQPSEFAKIGLILAQANFLSRPVEELRTLPVFLKSLGLTALPFVLVLKEPDLGSALVLFPVSFAMMFVAGVSTVFLRRLIFGAAALAALLLVDILFAPPQWQIKLEEYQRHRLLVWFGRDFAPANATPQQRQFYKNLQLQKSYNVEQALISVGSGGFWGKGWTEGTQSALGYLPRAVAHNDFIFSVIAEEKGFVGSLAVLGLYGAVLFCGLRVAGQARDRLGKLLAVGVVSLLFSHIFINIGMNIRLMPVTGIPLPLLSYGGSSVLCSLIGIGLIHNVHWYRRSY